MALTDKQEKFAQCIADGMTQADAYRAAFNVSPDSKPETAQKRACELMANGEIAGRVAELRERLSDVSLWRRVDSVLVLSDIAKGNDPDAKPSDRVSAVKELNAMHGFNAPQKVDHLNSDGSLRQNPTVIEIVAPEWTPPED